MSDDVAYEEKGNYYLMIYHQPIGMLLLTTPSCGTQRAPVSPSVLNRGQCLVACNCYVNLIRAERNWEEHVSQSNITSSGDMRCPSIPNALIRERVLLICVMRSSVRATVTAPHCFQPVPYRK